MSKPLPHRPNLDHLRRQAKTLLAGVRAGDTQAVEILSVHLPAAKGLSAEAIVSAGYRLADAQFAIARSTGFGSWPKLAQHVELLRKLEGTWSFVSLEVDGNPIPAPFTQHSRILIDGDRFRTESPEAIYEGVFNIDAETSPHHIDIEFVEGPEAGNWNFGIFRLDGDRLEICLDMHGNPRPEAFGSSKGDGRAYEMLRRDSNARPEAPGAGIVRSGSAQSHELKHRSSFESSESPAAVNRVVPYLHVRDMSTSLAFYARLGFSPKKSVPENSEHMYWALASSGEAEIMLARASGPIDADQQAVLLYMFSTDLKSLRSHLLAHGLRDGGAYTGRKQPDDAFESVYEIAHPSHMQAGEMRVIDPDGYVILVGQLY